MARIFFTSFFLLSISYIISAQKLEVGGWLGGCNYYGDINTNTNIVGTRQAVGLLFRNNISNYVAYKLMLSYGATKYSDQSFNTSYQSIRNLNTSISIFELSYQWEFNFFEYIKGDKANRYTPYLTAGLGTFYFMNSPSAVETTYSPVQISVPYGLGFKYNLNFFWNIGLEIVNRATFTDYIDDISTTYSDGNNPFGIANKQRGDSSKKDKFLFLGLTLTYNYRQTKCPEPGNDVYKY